MSSAAAQTSDDAIGVAEVVVTAQRRSELLKDVPIAIQALSGEKLAETGFHDLRDIISLVPGASEGRGNAAGIRSYQIRGVSSFYGDSTIGYYLDEAAYVIPNRNYAPVARSFDLERIEVLRGPQGTLYGLGSMGGAMRFITADPDLEEFRVKGDLAWSDTKGGKSNSYGDLAISVPLAKGVAAIRGTASIDRRGGFAASPSFPGDLNNGESENYRLKFLMEPSDDLTVRFGYTRNITSDDWGQNFATTNPAAFPRSPVPGRNRQSYDMYTGFVSYDAGPAVLESSTGFVDRIDRASGPIILGPGPSFRLDVLGESESFVQELRAVSTGEGPLRWVVGGIYMDATNLEDIKVIGGPPISAVSSYHSESTAVFGEVSYGFLNDTLRPLVGLRYFKDNRDFYSLNRPPGPVQPPAFRAKETFDSINPRFNLAWKPSEEVNLYANVARGFRSGTFNTAAAVSVSGGTVAFGVNPDSLWSYEVGGKFTLFDKRLYVELVAYHLDWSDIQLNYTVAGGVQVIRNAGQVTGDGVEFALNWNVAPGLTLQASGNANATKFDQISNPAVFAATPNIAVGKQVASVPERTFSLGANYNRPITDHTSLVVNATYSFASRQGDPGDTLGRYGQSQQLLRGRVGVQLRDWGLFVFGENLLGEDDPIQISGSGRSRQYPQVVGVELSVDY